MNKENVFKMMMISIVALLIVSLVLVVLLICENKNTPSTIMVAENSISEETEKNISEGIIIESPKPIEKPEEQEPQYELTPGKYHIKVNNEMNTVTIYIKDENNNYTIPVKAMICSTGEATPKNVTYTMGGKRWEWRLLFGNVYGQYTTHINQDILFHSVPYVTNKDKSSLEYWEYDKLGTVASLGCIRLKVEDAKWIYENCLAGSTVEFYYDSNPGPLGKPTAMKISEYEEYRNWDPTDSDENNPWKNFEGEIY